MKKYKVELFAHLLFWAAVTYMLGSITSISISQQSHHGSLTMNQDVFKSFFPLCLITVGFLMLLVYGNVFWLFKKAILYKNKYKPAMFIFTWFFFNYFANYIVTGFFFNNPHPLFNRLSPLLVTERNWNDWDHRQLLILNIFLCMFGISAAYYFAKAWIKNELIKTQLEANQLSTEIKFLKSQINPHFLFNTLNNFFSMAQAQGNEELADGISKLSGMMRYMIYDSNTESVTLSKEIEYLEDAVSLNKLRYAEDEVNITLIYTGQIEALFIAPMIFIPFVENAFKHGVLIGWQSPIDISISVADKQLIFTCENKDYGFIEKMNDSNSGIGLENITRRLELVYPGKFELFIKRENGKYVVKLGINLA